MAITFRFTALGCVVLAFLLVMANVGGILNGFQLIEYFFRTIPHLNNLGSNTVPFLLISINHICVAIFGIIAIVCYSVGYKATGSCVTIAATSLVGTFAAGISDMNVTAEVLGTIFGFAAALLGYRYSEILDINDITSTPS